MATPYNPYISKVYIRNFRNYLETEVELGHKQVIIGENNVGKTNFLRALQLILDPNLSDTDRTLTESDFHDSLEEPMKEGEEIEIYIEIQGYAHNSKLMAQFDDAIVSETPPTLRFTYLFRPVRDPEQRIIKYEYLIFKGKREDAPFRGEDRSYINIQVIRALRDVERELKANKQSPLYKLVKKYEVAVSDLEDVAEAMSEAAEKLLELDEIVHIQQTLQARFSQLSGLQRNSEVTLRTFDVDIERLLYNLQVYMGMEPRPVSELSLGLANILYVCLMLILIKDRTVPPILKAARYAELLAVPGGQLLDGFYHRSEKGNYILNDQIDIERMNGLYDFMDGQNFQHQAFTILAVEEPEAHLHPVLQRLLYREILHKSSTSVIFTSHSTFIASVAPVLSIVHIRAEDEASEIFSSIGLTIPMRERRDIERYVDAKRGELYFGKGVILVEGISEEYIIPAAAQVLGTPLDDQGIIVCNIDSANFKPYVQLLNLLHIPWVLFTDGDYYEKHTKTDKDTGKTKEVRVHHILRTDDAAEDFYRGHDQLITLLKAVYELDDDDITEDAAGQEKIFADYAAYVGFYTLEVDIMETGKEALHTMKKVYAELILGGDEMRENFEKALDDGDYWAALTKIENNISKGRFAQRLSDELTVKMIPRYIKKGIKKIAELIEENYE
jgi:putative ATP-dependent endonuclease of OLD family